MGYMKFPPFLSPFLVTNWLLHLEIQVIESLPRNPRTLFPPQREDRNLAWSIMGYMKFPPFLSPFLVTNWPQRHDLFYKTSNTASRIAPHAKDFTWNRGCSSNSPPLKHGDQIPSSPGRQRCQMPGVLPGGMSKLRFDRYITHFKKMVRVWKAK